MSRTFEGVFIRDYLNLYLVANKLKPATGIIFIHNYPNDNRIDAKTQKQIYTEQMNLKKKNILQHKKTLEKLEVMYHIKENTDTTKIYNEKNEEIGNYFQEIVLFDIAKDAQTLDKLIELSDCSTISDWKKFHQERGQIYGYPKEAVEAFSNRKIIAVDMLRNIELARNQGIIIPTWIAYLTHVLEKSDFINNDISQSSRELGEKYQEFIKINNPKLAKIVEKEYFRTLPKTRILENGQIELIYSSDKVR